jgi:hypothetical protein
VLKYIVQLGIVLIRNNPLGIPTIYLYEERREVVRRR